MSNTFLDDLDAVDPSTIDIGQVYTPAQWHNGQPQMAQVGGVAHTGGMLIELKHVDAALKPAPSWVKTQVTFDKGNTEPVLATQKLALAVVRWRFQWIVKRGGEAFYYPRASWDPKARMRGYLQVLAGIYGYDFPVAITFTGKASQAFERLLQEFNAKAIALANKVATENTGGNGQKIQRLPRFAFYMKVVPGPAVRVGKPGEESTITPPALNLPPTITPEYLSAIYVGRSRLIELQQLFHEAEAWATEWDRGQHTEGEAESGADTSDDEGG